MKKQLTIYSGGAKGVDTTVEHLCNQHGHHCTVYIPPCHPRATQLTPLTRQQLNQAQSAVIQSSERLGRTVNNPVTWQYLARNWFVVKDATLVLAFGYFDERRRHVGGGTGWSVDMAIKLQKPVYVFDLIYETWNWWNPQTLTFVECDGMTDLTINPPTLQEKTAIVGTREYAPEAEIELRRLFHEEKSQ